MGVVENKILCEREGKMMMSVMEGCVLEIDLGEGDELGGGMMKGMLKERGYVGIWKWGGLERMVGCLMRDGRVIYMGLDGWKQDIEEMVDGEDGREKGVYVFLKREKRKGIEEGVYEWIYRCLECDVCGDYCVHVFGE
ncbi:hypothetical protein, partial [Bacillus pumilus]|uniref:hypothetical protein n=1 Tax=Bacillus pumilus TaxID=1408 RepID=UPI003F68B00D